MLGRLFGKSKRRIGAEEFGRLLSELAVPTERAAEGQERQVNEIFAAVRESKPELLGVALVEMSAVIWAAARHGFVSSLPSDRFAAMIDAYYGSVWERITSRFGNERGPYDEFVRRLGAFIIPDSIKADWALRTGVHDILSVAIAQIGPAADEFVAAREDERGAKGLALGDSVGKVLFSGQPDRVETEVSVKVSISAYNLFNDAALALTRLLQDLERQGWQIV